jgi:hypothetical protein
VWKRGEVHTGFWWGNLWEGENVEDPGICIYGRTLLIWIFKDRTGDMYWIDLA